MIFLEMLLRAKKVILFSFAVIFALLLVLVSIKPEKYEAHMSLLFRNALAENLVSADPTQNMVQHQGESDTEVEEKINSEVELLQSSELLKSVVLDNGLEKSFLTPSGDNRAVAVEKAARQLSKRLSINPVRKSEVVEISYTSSDRDQAKRVLDSLSREYFSQYAELHNSGGASAFYKARSEALNQNLQQAEERRAKLLMQSGYMILPEGEHLGLGQIVDLQNARNQAMASLAETESRLKSAKTQQSTNPDRIVTQRRVSANPASVEQAHSKLIELQNRLTELRTKFLDGDPLVVQVEQQIADTQRALTSAQALHSEDVSTDVSVVRQTLDNEANQLTQARAGLASRVQQLDQQLADEKNQLDGMEHARIDVSSLDRDIKVLQANADLYRTKALIASAAEEMDPQKFSNVVEASHPTVPVLPLASRFNATTSFLLALLLSLCIGLASEWRNMEEYSTEGATFGTLETAASS